MLITVELRHRQAAQRSIDADGWTAIAQKTPDVFRDQNYRRKYGITVEEYDRMLEAQDGGCAICKTKTPDRYGRFHIDHCHDTGQIRALLCGTCNCAIGLMGDSPERLEAGAAYLRRFKRGQSP